MMLLAPIKLVNIKKKKKEIIPYSPLEQITPVCSIALRFVFRNCLLALVYLVVWPMNFTFAHLLDSNLLSRS